MFEKLLGIGVAFAEGTAASGTAQETAEVNPIVSLLFTFAPMILIFSSRYTSA